MSILEGGGEEEEVNDMLRLVGSEYPVAFLQSLTPLASVAPAAQVTIFMCSVPACQH